MTTHQTAWALWNMQFQDGDDCFVLDVDELVYQGRIQATEEELIITPPGKRAIPLAWAHIMFVAHDGFPARKLMGADGSKSAEKLDKTNTTTALRQIFGTKSCSACYGLIVPTPERALKEVGDFDGMNKYRRCRACSLAFADPYYIEGVGAYILNPGNDGIAFNCEEGEEVMVFKAPDGASGLLWGVGEVFHVEPSL